MTQRNSQDDTVERVEPVLSGRFADTFFVPGTSDLRFKFGAASHMGKVRQNNEDHYVIVKRRRTAEILLSNLSPDDLPLADDACYGMVVADGMGGANFGEFASQLVIQRMLELSQQASSWVMKCTDLDAQQIRHRVAAYVDEIQATLKEYINANPPLAGMGTTWTSAHLMPPHAVVVHVGDSRAYLLRDGELEQITHDDTFAQAYIDSGGDPASVKKLRHLLLNSFGGAMDDVQSQIYLLDILPGDQFLVCSDGLTDMVDDLKIAATLHQEATPQAACDQLISAALASGGNDNITVLVAHAAGR
jgi:PPM family protein phosphatase